jgi:superfamily II DNA or RNA helicase
VPIDPEAIAGFLAREPATRPDFKAKTPAELLAHIQVRTGLAYAPKTPPRPAQLAGLAMALHLERALLFFGMRMGKTKIGLDFASHLRRAGRWKGKGLVIAHAPVGVPVWVQQAAIHSHLKVAGIASGPGAQRQLAEALDDDTDLLVMAWSTLINLCCVKRLDRKGRSVLQADKKNLEGMADIFELLIVDEIDACQDHMSLRFEIGSLIAAQARFRLGLTGTPIGRNPMAVWPQVYLIDQGTTLSSSFYFFEACFGKKKSIWIPGKGAKEVYVFDMDKLPILKHKLESIALSYELSETQQVAVEKGQVELEMEGDQLAAYEKTTQEMMEAHYSDTASIENHFIRLRQISAGFLPFIDEQGQERKLQFYANAKLKWLSEFVESLQHDVQCIIFHEFILTGELISAELQKHRLAHSRLHGQSKNKAEVIAAFQRGESRFLIANTATGSRAIDLPMADYLLFYESPLSPKIRAQAEARPASRGSKALVIDDLVCSPVDRKILNYVREGKSILHDLVFARRELGLLTKRRK